MASKLCDSCKSATATLFCRPDSAFLCLPCDSKIHAANKLASRHPRVSLCEVCEQAPAHVTCKADAASLCVTCDRDIHSANPLARRHDRVPITPFYDTSAVKPAAAAAAINFLDDHGYFSDAGADADVSSVEAEAASWLLPTPSNPKAPDLNSGQYVFSEIDPVPYVDLEFGSVDQKMESQEQNSSGITTDGVVPFVYSYKYNTQSQCVSLSHNVSSSSMEVGVVPDGNTMSEISNCGSVAGSNETVAVQISAADREARVLRYREKRKTRRFEKTIRYASRKAYAETRPRIKGRFAKRSDVDVLAVEDHFTGYGVVPTC